MEKLCLSDEIVKVLKYNEKFGMRQVLTDQNGNEVK